MAAVSRPPWENVPLEDQLFVLVTGANGGVGLGIAKRLIDEFLVSRSPSAHLILILTTRSHQKCLETIATLRAHAVAGGDARHPSSAEDARACAARIHIISLALDLCDIRGIYAFAERLVHGPVSNPPGLDAEYVVDVSIPRLDSVILNAGYGGWSGFSMPRMIWSVLRDGLVHAVTWPAYLLSLPTCVLNERESYGYPQKPLLGEVFTACTFGHYLLVRQLLPLLNRPAARGPDNDDDDDDDYDGDDGPAPLPPGRVVWCSSLDVGANRLRLDDIQCFLRPEAYESSKRVIDLLSLTATLPATRHHVRQYLQSSSTSRGTGTRSDDAVVPPQMYLTHPGVVASTLFPLPWYLFWLYRFTVVFTHWLGSPWHNRDSYNGSVSAVWIALSDHEELDDSNASLTKWGSASGRNYEPYVKATEVEKWGFEGQPENAESIAADTSEGVLHRSRGRRAGAPDTTEEDLIEFEEQGAKVWAEMESLRHQCEKALKIGDFA